MGNAGKAADTAMGTIKTEDIANAREMMRQIVVRFMEIKKTVADTRMRLNEDWVGKGRNEFESQYSLLISKVSDIGDTLDEMYNLLVEAEAKYQEADDGYHQSMVMSMEEAGIKVDDANKGRILSGDRRSSDDKRKQAGGGGN